MRTGKPAQVPTYLRYVAPPPKPPQTPPTPHPTPHTHTTTTTISTLVCTISAGLMRMASWQQSPPASASSCVACPRPQAPTCALTTEASLGAQVQALRPGWQHALPTRSREACAVPALAARPPRRCPFCFSLLRFQNCCKVAAQHKAQGARMQYSIHRGHRSGGCMAVTCSLFCRGHKRLGPCCALQLNALLRSSTRPTQYQAALTAI